MDREYLRSLLKAIVGPMDWYSDQSVGNVVPGADGSAMMQTPGGSQVNLPQDFAYNPQSREVFEPTPDPWDRMTFLPIGQNIETGAIRPALPNILNAIRRGQGRISERYMKGLSAPKDLQERDWSNIIGPGGMFQSIAQYPRAFRAHRDWVNSNRDIDKLRGAQ